jgi:flagellar hook-associated protein 3 FlgL
MRIADNMRFGSVQQSLADLRSRHAEVANQLTSGRRVVAPSSDPLAAAELTNIEARLARAKDFRATIASVRADASLSERTLAEASQLLVHAQELAVQGANDSLSGQDRALIATEVSALKQQFLTMANTRGTRGHLFSGSQTQTSTLSSAGVFQGDSVQHQVEIAPGVTADVTVSGAQAFTSAGGTDVFAALDSLEQALNANSSTQIAGTLTNLEAARSQIVNSQARAGMIMNRLDAADESLSIGELDLNERRSKAGDVDPINALSQLTQLSTALEQALGVARIMLNTGIDRF